MSVARSDLQSEWRRFRRDKPGQRFQNLYERRQRNSPGYSAQRIFTASAGFIVMAIGLILVPAPGPGWLITAAGAALIATEFLTVARWMDAGELKVRGWLRGIRKKRAAAGVAPSRT